MTYPEHLEEGLLGDDQALELLLFLDGEVGDLLERGVVAVHDWPMLQVSGSLGVYSLGRDAHLSSIAIS